MAPSVKQLIHVRAGLNATSATLTLPGAPTAGNLLIVGQGAEKIAGTWTNPLGWQTPLISSSSTSVSLFATWKVSSGSETSVTLTWTTSSPNSGCGWYAEIEDTAVTGTSWELLGSANHPTDETAIKIWSSGTTGAVAADGQAYAWWTVDTQTSISTPQAFTNGFTQLYEDTDSGTGAGIYVASGAITNGNTAESTMSYTGGTADQLAGVIGVWRKLGDITVTGNRLKRWRY